MACIEIQRRIIPLDKEFNPENFDSLEFLNKGVKPFMVQRSSLTGPYNQINNPGLQRFCPYIEDDNDEQISLPAFPLQQSTVKDKGSKPQRYISAEVFEALPRRLQDTVSQCKASQPVFTLKDVAIFIQKAVDLKEKQLNDKFEKELSARLEEQHREFTQINAEFQKKYFSDKPCSYYS